jgi:hypothetical protein
LIHNHDFISKLPVKPFRQFSSIKESITDSIAGTVPWEKLPIEDVLARIIEARLNRAIAAVGRKEAS